MSTLVLVRVVCSIATILIARLAIPPTIHALRSRSWIPLDATLEFIERIGTDSGFFLVDLRYRYTDPDGVERRGTRYSMDSKQASTLQRFREALPGPPTTGSQIKVFVNPEDYGDSVVLTGLTGSHLFGLTLALCGFALLVTCFFVTVI